MRDGHAIAAALGGRRERCGWAFVCPCHGTGRRASAIIFDSGVLYCHAGCDRRDIAAALDVDFPDDGKTVKVDYEKIAADEAARIAKARQMWALACALDDESSTPYVAYYLKSRGVTLPVPAVLRRWRDENGKGFIAKLDNLDGGFTSVHTKTPHEGRNYGPMKRGAVQLFPPLNGEIGLAESIFDALSASQITGVPCWAVCGTRLDAIDLPADVTHVTIFSDNDEAGRAAARDAEQHYRCLDRKARIWAPPNDVKDWNEELIKRIKRNGR